MKGPEAHCWHTFSTTVYLQTTKFVLSIRLLKGCPCQAAWLQRQCLGPPAPAVLGPSGRCNPSGDRVIKAVCSGIVLSCRQAELQGVAEASCEKWYDHEEGLWQRSRPVGVMILNRLSPNKSFCWYSTFRNAQCLGQSPWKKYLKSIAVHYSFSMLSLPSTST